jgi:PPOX class probable F420-dependent enzyme
VTVSSLANERYIRLTTYKRDGTPVATPVWVVSDDGTRLLVWTGSDTWKAKRLRRDARVLVAASDGRGNAKGDAIPGTARFVDEGELVTRLLRKKYGWQKRGLDMFNNLMRRLQRRPRARAAYLEIVDAAQQQV